MGVVSGGIHVMVVVFFWAVIAVVIPGALYLAYRLVQYGYDFIIARFIIRKYLVRRK